MVTKVVNKNKESFDVYIGRGSKWGNPFSHRDGTKAIFKVSSRKIAIESYKNWILYGDGKHLLNHISELEGKRLGFFCKPKSCHGDVLLELLKSKPI